MNEYSIYEIIYDYSGTALEDGWHYMEPEDRYYDCEEHNIRETFVGTWTELQEFIKEMKENGCYNITATCISDGDYEAW